MEPLSRASHQVVRRPFEVGFTQYNPRRGRDGCISPGVPRDDGLLRKLLKGPSGF